MARVRVFHSALQSSSVGGVGLALLTSYAIVGLVASVYPAFDVLRLVFGLPLLLFVPGAMLANSLERDLETPGRFLLYAVAYSVVVLAVVVLALGFLGPLIGIERPISELPLAIALSVVVLALVAFNSRTNSPSVSHWLPDLHPLGLTVLLVLLPTVAAAGAFGMKRWGSSLGVSLFIVTTCVVVLLTSSRYFPTRQYPAVAFFVSISLLLHRNLVAESVVGADIQGLYGSAAMVRRTGQATIEVVGPSISVPVVSVVPAAFSTLTGLELNLVFVLVHSFLFALVPVGVYYLSSEHFGAQTALFASLFFSFYHVSFYFTPGKQLLSELFAILLLLAVFGRNADSVRRSSLGLLGTGLILTHYGTTYLLAASMLVAALAVTALDAFVEDVEIERSLSVSTPVLLLVGATAWYTYASAQVVSRMASIPAQITDQLTVLFFQGLIPGTGASYATQQTTIFDQLNVVLYIALTLLLAIGLASVVYRNLESVRRSEQPRTLEYAAVATPMFLFLGTSYFLSFSLWADRVYQMVLPVLAPFLPIGFLVLRSLVDDSVPSVAAATNRVERTYAVPVLLVVLLAFNSGFVFALAGSANTSTFSADANDLAFTSQERRSVEWLSERADITQYETYRDVPGSRIAVDEPPRVQVYTDSYSSQLFRSALPSAYHRTEVVLLKSKWRPSFDVHRVDDGFVYVRTRTVTTSRSEGVQPTSFTEPEVESLCRSNNVLYDSGAVRILRSTNATTSSR
ncbi:DUF2206 domain-containing protein [Halorubellus salinus]|uniref:DUF2206 domain-containing protein n=1 Tax=Halorubellus salinus TaxID=755309 RepID=UPI001D063420|nr:DUF2206 domain-containing protein [Halorubellus salinus]